VDRLVPAALQHGDSVAVVSPSTTIRGQEDAVYRSCDALEKELGLSVRPAEHVFARHYHSAGTTAERVSDFTSAMNDPLVKAIFFSIGGATAIDMIEGIDYGVVAANPKIIAGISDSTTLLDAINSKTGLSTFHGLEFLDFGRRPMSYTLQSMRDVLFGMAPTGAYQPNDKWENFNGEPTTYSGWRSISAGSARGITVGGNYEALSQLIGTAYEPNFDGSILFVEELGAHKRHIRAAMMQLRLRGIFERINALILGYWSGSDDPQAVGDEQDISDIVLDVCGDYTFPIMQIGEIGHNVENLILPIGASVSVNTTDLSLRLDEPAVAG
jgi:muramoyltetrapeptide carboxypeptidase